MKHKFQIFFIMMFVVMLSGDLIPLAPNNFTVDAQEINKKLPFGVETYLLQNISNAKLYNLNHIKNLPKYINESLTDFHMPIVYKIPLSAKMDVKKFLHNGSFLHSNGNFDDRILDYGYDVYGNLESDEYFIVDYWLKVKASNKPFSIDFIPKIELDNIKYNLPQYAWWNSSWDYCKYADVCNNITDYQVKVKVGKTSGGDVSCGGNCQDDFDDIRFTHSDNTTELSYWMQNYTSGVQATFWVNVSNASAICMYYGNTLASTTSNGTNTFTFFSDCDTLTGWDIDQGNPSQTGSVITLNKDTSVSDTISHYVGELDSLFVHHTRMKYDTSGINARWGCGVSTSHPATGGWSGAFIGFNLGDLRYYDGSSWTIFDSYSDNIYLILELYVNNTAYDFDAIVDGGTPSTNLDFRDNVNINDTGGYEGTTGAGYDLVIDWTFFRKYTDDTEPTFCNWSSEQQETIPCECLITNPNPSNNSVDISLCFNNFTVNVSSTCGSFDWVNISFLNYSHNVSTSLTNGSYYLNISNGGNLSYNTEYTWFVNTSCNDTINNTFFNFTTIEHSACGCDEIQIMLDKLLVDIKAEIEGDKIIEMETTQFIIFIQLVLFCIFLWMGYTIPAMEGNKKSIHYLPFSGGLFILFGGIDFISFALLLNLSYSVGLISGYLTIVGIILIVYGVIKAFYYSDE